MFPCLVSEVTAADPFIRPPPFVPVYYIGVSMRASAANQTTVWTAVLTGYVFIPRAMFIVNAKDGAWSTYYCGNLHLFHVSGGLLFHLPIKIPEKLEYFGL